MVSVHICDVEKIVLTDVIVMLWTHTHTCNVSSIFHYIRVFQCFKVGGGVLCSFVYTFHCFFVPSPQLMTTLFIPPQMKSRVDLPFPRTIIRNNNGDNKWTWLIITLPCIWWLIVTDWLTALANYLSSGDDGMSIGTLPFINDEGINKGINDNK